MRFHNNTPDSGFHWMEVQTLKLRGKQSKLERNLFSASTTRWIPTSSKCQRPLPFVIYFLFISNWCQSAQWRNIKKQKCHCPQTLSLKDFHCSWTLLKCGTNLVDSDVFCVTHAIFLFTRKRSLCVFSGFLAGKVAWRKHGWEEACVYLLPLSGWKRLLGHECVEQRNRDASTGNPAIVSTKHEHRCLPLNSKKRTDAK